MLLGLKFDKNKVTKLSSKINEALDRLHDLSNLEKNSFLSDPYKLASAKYFLIVAIEESIDMCNHLISMNKLRAPEDYSDTFRVLEEQGMFKKNFVKKLVEMARFRNRLVHIYWEVDDELIYKIICEYIKDIEEFIEKFTNYISS